MTDRTRHRSLYVLCLTGVLASVCGAHSDDPKVLDRQPRYEGPGYRAAENTDRSSRGQFDAQGVVLMAHVPLPEFGVNAQWASDCWGYTSPSGREYAIIDLASHTSFVEVTDPGNPVIIATLSGPNSLWRDSKVYGTFAYSVSEGGQGIQVFDLSAIDNGIVTYLGNVTTGGVSSTHNVAINEASGYLYRCGGASGLGLRVYNVQSGMPVYVSTWTDRYVHDAEIVSYTDGPYAGREIAFCCTGFNNGSVETGLEILDVTDKQDIITIGRIVYPMGAYSHQVWLSEDRRHVFLNDELAERDLGLPTSTLVFDVSDLSDPTLVATLTNGRQAITHNNYVRDGYLYCANYTDGLRIFDVSDPLLGAEVGYFDTRPESSATTFNGLWSVYPFFPSGTVIGSDIERGLFVWRIELPEVAIQFPDGRPELINPNGQTVDLQLVGRNGGSPSTEAPSLFVDDGGGFVEVALTSLGGDAWRAVFPAALCGHAVSYYFGASDANGLTVLSPPDAPATVYSAVVAGAKAVEIEDEFEIESGWIVGAPGDTATAGIWVRADPVGTAAQPEDDHTPDPGVMCFITGNAPPGASVGTNDIDGGMTTLTSPVFDATAKDGAAYVSYWRWYSNNQGASPNTDSWPIWISNNGGSSWVLLEDVTENAGAWVYREFRIEDFVTPTDQMRLRFQARDLDPPSVVEAGLDDFSVFFYLCPPASGCDGDADGSGSVDLDDVTFVVLRLGEGAGSPADVDGSGAVDLDDVTYIVLRLGQTCAE